MQFVSPNNGENGQKLCAGHQSKDKTPSPNAILPEAKIKNVCVVPHAYVLVFPKRKIFGEICVRPKSQSLSGIHHYSSTRVSFVDVGHVVSSIATRKPLKRGQKKVDKMYMQAEDD